MTKDSLAKTNQKLFRKRESASFPFVAGFEQVSLWGFQESDDEEKPGPVDYPKLTICPGALVIFLVVSVLLILQLSRNGDRVL